MPRFEIDLTDEEVEQIRELMMKLRQPIWRSFIPPGLGTLVHKLEHTFRKDK